MHEKSGPESPPDLRLFSVQRLGQSISALPRPTKTGGDWARSQFALGRPLDV